MPRKVDTNFCNCRISGCRHPPTRTEIVCVCVHVIAEAHSDQMGHVFRAFHIASRTPSVNCQKRTMLTPSRRVSQLLYIVTYAPESSIDKMRKFPKLTVELYTSSFNNLSYRASCALRLRLTMPLSLQLFLYTVSHWVCKCMT